MTERAAVEEPHFGLKGEPSSMAVFVAIDLQLLAHSQ